MEVVCLSGWSKTLTAYCTLLQVDVVEKQAVIRSLSDESINVVPCLDGSRSGSCCVAGRTVPDAGPPALSGAA